MLGFLKRHFGWKAHFDRGMSAGSIGDLSAAADHFRKAARIAPNEPYPHYELGYTLFLLGRYEDALRELKRTEGLSPGFFLVQTEIYLCEGVLSGKIGEDALAKLRELQRLTDSGLSGSADAVTLSQEAIAAAPECALGHFFLGKALFETDRVGAEASLRRCLELGPDDTTAIDALTHIGLLRDAAGDREGATKIWTDVLNRYRGNPHLSLTEMILSQQDPAG